MASISRHLRSRLLHTLKSHSSHHSHHYPIPQIIPKLFSTPQPFSPHYPTTPLHRFLSTLRPKPSKSSKSIDIGARARQLQNRRLWTYALTFSCIAGFIVIVLNNFQDQLVFYVTPTDALEKFRENPSKNKFRLGGLVLEGSVTQPASSPEMEFIVTDLITDILVKYDGSLPDLFREGHSVVVEGFIKPYSDENRDGCASKGKKIAEKAVGMNCYFSATEVLAKHDEKYMPAEVAAALERNKAKIEADSVEEKLKKNERIEAEKVEASADSEEEKSKES
ncbi:Cytochrome c-type biogenesis protein ccme-like protein [Thalictrum thalictroides]|uniref:Cytochrome c-type biogenesis protein ccme-like protein n=1 Tax=Thalictrum thalictroides TaxID=46969 RepID=A0A7J6VBJ0_THATH|nr:Cytochrome c-type biogenesis protein ccme-like protein [Thalictrum thalictroides]